MHFGKSGNKQGFKFKRKPGIKQYKKGINSIDDYLKAEKMNSINQISNNIYNKENIQKRKEIKTNNKSNIKEEHKNESPKKIFISYRNLNELISKGDNEIIQFFMKYKDLSEVIKNTNFTTDMIYLLVDIMSRIVFINSGPATIILKQIIENTNFIEVKIKHCLINYDLDEEKYLNFLLNLIKFSDKLLDKYSHISKRIKPGDLLDIEDILSFKQEENIIDDNDELIKKILAKIKQFKEREKQININKLKQKEEKGKVNQKDINIPIDYKSCDLILKMEDFNEIYNKQIAPYIKFGPYYSYERYINTNFYLEREDCYRSLRNAINNLSASGKSINYMNYKEIKNTAKNFSNLYFYINGEINYIEINNSGVIITLDFLGINARKIIFTKRMITGSLIILTDNDYSDYLLTTVFYNPYFDLKENEKNNNKKCKIKIPKKPLYRVQLSLINISPQSFLFLVQNRKNLQIFESKAYFESYIHIMKRLQQLNTKDLPFKSELIDVNFKDLNISQPKDGYTYNNLTLYPDKEFPSEFKILLDDSQLKAAKLTLLNKIALIQGPPGTGKTHFGAIICNILLQNLNKTINNNIIIDNENNSENSNENDYIESDSEDKIDNKQQILLVCYTNHALDQIVEKILQYTNNIVRIGGRCKNEKVKKYELHNRRKTNQYRSIISKLNNLGKEMKKVTSLIDIRRRINASIVEKEFQNLYKKVVNDFLLFVSNSMPFSYYKQIKITPQIERKIYLFWNKIGNEKNEPYEIIDLLLENLNIPDEKWYNLSEAIYNLLKGYDIDNFEILRFLNNNNNNYINENNNNYINNNNNYINENNINENNEEKEEEEEEEDEYDEEEILENEDKLKYMEDNLGFDDNVEDDDEEEEEQELLDENDTEFRKLTPLNEEKFNFLINSRNNFFRLGPKIIKLFIDYMKNQLLIKELNNQYDFDEFNELLNKKNEIALISDAEIIKNSKIVCMTTTGCAKYSTILEQLNFQTIIIEEAAEVKESHVISLLTKNTKRLILIGDHNQLQPKPYNYEIATKYNLNISLFERLVNNNIPFASLKYQRRMKSKFADFVRIIYGGNDYIDYKDVNNKDNIKGMVDDMYIISHNELEKENLVLKSKENDYEAQYLAKLCNYLLLQGYNTDQITILTFYIAQVILIRKYLKQYDIKNVKVSSVDNYQGEECDIILLSLVRSNKNNEIGFLRTFNRVCVSFSRAKLGFYIIGNFDCIVKGEEKLNQKLNNNEKNIKFAEKMIGIWGKIRKKAEELKIIGNELILECQNHKRKAIISKISDFDNCPEGGCQEPCKKRMACGHVCEKLCHVYNCNEQKCFKPCTRKYSPCGHPCNKLCSEKCDKCEKIVEKKLPCGHIKKKCKCSDDKYFIQCYEKCERKLKCGHSCKLKCYEICESISCKEKVEKILSCGHKNLVECGKQLYELICEEKCQINLECGHDCKGTCGRCLEGTLHVKCESKCDRVLPCGHPCNQKCSAECICEKKCENICLHGYCDDKCCEICVDCKEKCKIGCKHEKCKKKCGELCTRKPCDKRCEKKMECGHQCYGLCGERCPNVCRICNPKMQCFIEDFFYLTELNEDELLYKTNCGHIFSVEGMDYYIKNNRKIQMYSCPVCMKSLILEPRYQNYIKNMFIDIQKLKKISLERNFGKDGETFFSKSKKLVNRILKQYGEEEVETDKQKSKIKREKENIFIRHKRQKIDIFEAYPTKINYQNNDLQIKIPTIYNLCKNEFKNKKNVNLKKKYDL